MNTEEALSAEVVRKLQLATEAESKEDREIICEEVFSDIAGVLDKRSQKSLGLGRRKTAADLVEVQGMPEELGNASINEEADVLHSILNFESGSPVDGPAFYEVLALFYQRSKESGATVANLCQELWGQACVAPIFALLLHRWLLLSPPSLLSASSAPQGTPVSGSSSELTPPHTAMSLHLKQVGVLALGAKQLFLGEVQAGQSRFSALYGFLAREVCFSGHGPAWVTLAGLPLSTKSELLSAVAAVLPYYSDPLQLNDLIGRFPAPSSVTIPASSQPPEGSGRMPLSGIRTPLSRLTAPLTAGSGADFLIGEVVDILGKIRSEAGLIRYLAALRALGGSPHLKALHPITSLRLQSELYSLASPGGPHYAPRAVRAAAMSALDATYPLGRRTRRVVRTLFRLLHPTDWLGEFWLAPLHWWTALYSRAVLAVVWVTYRVLASVRALGGRRSRTETRGVVLGHGQE